jgi:tRNA-splicing ligase RtcB
VRHANRDGLLQLGTLGRGNHFIELELDQNGYLWVLVHSGSRSMGQAITDWHLRNSQKSAVD